jgi:hypothetical protein
MINPTGISLDVSHAIQLALAPVFLLTGIAGMLNVMAGRLARIVDRGRYLVETPSDMTAIPTDKRVIELLSLERRRWLAGAAITACTLSALLVCTVIAMLFLEALMELPLKWLEGVIFTSASISLVVGLAFFLHEVHIANQTVKIESEFVIRKGPVSE